MQIDLKPNDYAFVFRQDGTILLATGEDTSRDGMTTTVNRIRAKILKGLTSGDQQTVSASELASIIIGTVLNPSILQHITAVIGSIPDGDFQTMSGVH